MNALWQRRARPALGTLVEVAAIGGTAGVVAAIEAAFAAIVDVQSQLSRFDPGSDIARFNALPAGGSLAVGAPAQAVLVDARRLAELSDGAFDVALGSGGWALRGPWLHKQDAGTRLDLGGIAKGHAVDCAVDALRAGGCSAGCVNAGGDLRCFGEPGVELWLRDEQHGGVRAFGRLHDGAFATSCFAPGSRSALAGGDGSACHVSVIAPTGLWADALTKVAALQGSAARLERFGARAWWH